MLMLQGYKKIAMLVIGVMSMIGRGFAQFSPLFSAVPGFAGSGRESCQQHSLHKEGVSLDPTCLLQGKLPRFTLEEKVDIVWDYLADWGKGYQPELQQARYHFESLPLKNTLTLFPLAPELRKRLVDAKAQSQLFLLDKAYIAPLVIQDLAFFSSHKDISMLGPCTRHNYLLAFEHLDAKVLQPGEQFNFNRYLMGLRGYCKGLGNNDFLFYGGVCGVASQLFRSGLSAPQVRIDQRWGHNNWYSKYYGEHVEGDDAAVYERNKWLTFTNIAQRPMMIKVWNQGDETVLFFVIEADAVQGQWVQITKQKHSHLAVDLSKQVYQVRDQQGVWCAPQLGKITALQPFDCDLEEDAHLLGEQNFSSRYLKIENASL